jgi:ATP-binding cassette subfamily B (MDR/TAP) protein 1
LNRQKYFEDNYAKANERPHRLARRKAVLSSIGFGLLKGLMMYISAVVFYAGVRFIMMGITDFEGMYISMMVLVVASEQLGHCSTFAKTFTKAKISALSIFQVIDRKPNIDFGMEGKEPPVGSLDGDVEFKDIAFSYPARPNNKIFSGQFNIQGKAGMTIALVGPSGCGKSTTIGMLQRWYDPSHGQVSLDRNDVKSFTLRNLRAHMALVGQEPVLFDMSIRDNVEFGIDKEIHGGNVTLEQMEEACKFANIHDFIMSLPDGYNTRVGDKGSQLSGGQKQRIAIARALIRKPAVLLLDEATSALDSDSEKVVQTALDNIIEKNNRTTITIAHRLSTVQNADFIYVIKDGIVAEQGTHWQLLELNGIYKGLVIEQSLAA